jgi:hypothetical protein
VLEFLIKAIRKERNIKGLQIRKKEVRLSLFSADMMLYLKGPSKLSEKEISKTFPFTIVLKQ